MVGLVVVVVVFGHCLSVHFALARVPTKWFLDSRSRCKKRRASSGKRLSQPRQRRKAKRREKAKQRRRVSSYTLNLEDCQDMLYSRWFLLHKIGRNAKFDAMSPVLQKPVGSNAFPCLRRKVGPVRILFESSRWGRGRRGINNSSRVDFLSTDVAGAIGTTYRVTSWWNGCVALELLESYGFKMLHWSSV